MNDDPPTREVTLCTSRPGSRADAVQEEGGWTPTAGMARSPCGADDASRREPGRDRRWGLGRGHRPSAHPFPGRAAAIEGSGTTGLRCGTSSTRRRCMSLPSVAGLPSSLPRTSTSVRSAIFLGRFGTEDTPTRRAKAAGAAVQYAKESAHAHTLAYVRVFSAMTATLDGCSHRAPCTETPSDRRFSQT